MQANLLFLPPFENAGPVLHLTNQENGTRQLFLSSRDDPDSV